MTSTPGDDFRGAFWLRVSANQVGRGCNRVRWSRAGASRSLRLTAIGHHNPCCPRRDARRARFSGSV